MGFRAVRVLWGFRAVNLGFRGLLGFIGAYGVYRAFRADRV